MSTDNELLGLIAECLDLLAQYSARGREAFLAERLIQDAIVRDGDSRRCRRQALGTVNSSSWANASVIGRA